MKKRSYIKNLLGIILVFLSTQLCFGEQYEGNRMQQQFVNRKLTQLRELMPNVTLPDSDSIMKCEVLPDNKSLIVRYNYKHEIEHLGVSLFSKETKQMLDESVCDFLERFLLELVLQKSEREVKRKLIEYHVFLKYNGADFGKDHFVSIYQTLHDLVMPVGFTLHYANKKGLATWDLKHEKSLSLLFPMSADLIIGMDKKEADNHVYSRLVQLQTQSDDYIDEAVCFDDLIKKDGDVYLKKGSTFLIPSLNSDTYYEKKTSGYLPLFQAALPEQSLKTLFHTFTNGTNVKLLLTHRQYGHFTPEIELPLNNFLAMFKRDFEIFTYSKKKKDGKIEIIAVIRHKNLNYIHLLHAVNTGEIQKLDELILNADFYSNIPQHYIKSLFNIKKK